jgi:hypothetical protein
VSRLLLYRLGKILVISFICALTDFYSVSLAATWDRDVIEQVGQILVDECRSKEVDVLLGPTGEYSISYLFLPLT